MLINDSDEKKIYKWAGISFCYTPFHDQLFGHHLLPHGIVNGLYAGVAGACVSFLANKIYDWLKNKENYACLKFKDNQHWIKTTGQLAARCIIHIAVGTFAGGVWGLFISSVSTTAAAGLALGFAASLGPQLVLLIYKTATFAISRIFTEIVDPIEPEILDPIEPEIVDPIEPEIVDPTRNEIQGKDYLNTIPSPVKTLILNHISIEELQSMRFNKTWNAKVLMLTIQRAIRYGYICQEDLSEEKNVRNLNNKAQYKIVLNKYKCASQYLKDLFKGISYVPNKYIGKTPEETLWNLEKATNEDFFQIAKSYLLEMLPVPGRACIRHVGDPFLNFVKFLCQIGKSRSKEILRNMLQESELKDYSPSFVIWREEDFLQLWILLGLDLNKDHPHILPTIINTSYERYEGVKKLLKHGVNPNQVSENGYSALTEAVEINDISCVSLLIEKGADAKFCGNQPEGIPRLRAAFCSSLEILKLIWEHDGGDQEVDRKSPHGSTALLCAAESTDEEKIRFLVQKGCSLTAKDGDGDTPLSAYKSGSQRAKKNPNQEIITLLKPTENQNN